MLRSRALGPIANATGTDASEIEIVRRAQAGERRAFDLLVRRYQKRILRFLTRYTRDASDAEDASQETFLKAYEGLKQFRCESAFYTWLHRIAINSANSLLVMRSRHSAGVRWDALTGSDAMVEVPAQLQAAETPEQVTSAEEVRCLVETALASLPAGQRTAMMLRELEGRPYAAIAKAMLIPIGTVRSRVFRARELLDKQLRQVVDGGLGRRLTRRSSLAAGQLPLTMLSDEPQQ